MHRQIHAQCRIDLTLEAASFLLVKGQGQKGEFFQAVDPADGVTKNCIPATSLKGVWRSAAERILRSFDASLACDPFSEQSCSKRMESKSVAPAQVFADLCPACRLFGCTAHAGLLHCADAWCSKAVKRNPQTRIAVDRVTGTVAKRPGTGATFENHALMPGSLFQIKELALDNFALWQIGLVALLIRDMNDGYIRLGFGTRQGMGHVKLHVKRITIRYPKSHYDSVMQKQAADNRQEMIVPALALGQESAHTLERTLDQAILQGLNPRPVEGESWMQRLWTEYRFTQEQDIETLFRACVQKALAPRLRQGRTGFYRDDIVQGVGDNVSLSQPL